MTTIRILFFVHWLRLFEANPHFEQSIFFKRTVDLSKGIEYPFAQECLQVVSDSNNEVGQMMVAFRLASFYVRSERSLELRDIMTERKGQCETFLIFVERMNKVNKMLTSIQTSAKQFFPFTKIYFHFEHQHNSTTDREIMFLLRKFLLNNALFGYVLEYKDNGNELQILTTDLLTNDIRSPVASSLPKELLHPLLDTHSIKKRFRISLFNCPPYTIYLEDDDGTVMMDTMDGLEYRLMHEITKSWKKNFKFRDFTKVKINPYAKILDDLSNESSDMAMCALWLVEDINRNFDLSTFYVNQCLTFLVPKPIKLNEATAIYTTLHSYVWLLFSFFLLLSIFLLNNIAKIEKRLNGSDSVFTDITVTVIETLNTATSHSVVHFPYNQTSVKLVLTSWIFLSFWMGISYTTIYASRLTSPSYEKPINTVKEVIDKELFICNAYFDVSTMEPLRESVHEEYRQLANRSIVYGENFKYRRQMITERRCAIFEVLLRKKYVSLLKLKGDLELVGDLRPMRNCITTHFTGSTEQAMLNKCDVQYQESGIVQKWHSDILRPSQYITTLFDDYPDQYKSTHSITILNVSGAFFLLGIGLLLASLAYVAELVKNRRENDALTLGRMLARNDGLQIRFIY
ncbi:hypothetical protein Bhyg_07044 [Pseudolycoriella hygida]|uniref:Ionotropic glutamate receptor C-terminal domain-containing protein n=1 Tax=Pseudolycoriella hygida TaxID=35572 RepID=A0A9Q0N1U6_9DIPT|nr:hypothetical protein Bhyg_07044 [Pseudolycoriella hygida]